MIIIGELINTSRKSVATYIKHSDEQAIQKLAVDQYNAGADFIDVNAGLFADREIEYLKWMIGLVQEVVPVPCCIDSPSPKVIEAALTVHKGIPMVNSISLEKDRFEQLIPVIAGTDLKVVALCMSEEGMPETADQRMRIAEKLINELVKNNIALENIFVDPLVQPISVNQTFGHEFLGAIERIMTTFTGVHTTCGLSNISYGLPNRPLLNRQFMGLAIAKGLDSAIVDPLHKSMMEVILATETLYGRDEFCRNYLQSQKEAKKEAEVAVKKAVPKQFASTTGKLNAVRIQQAMKFEIADQIPFTLNVNGPFFSYFTNIHTMDYYDSAEVMLKAQLTTFHHFGRITAIGPEMSLAPEASALGAEIAWSDDGTAWVEPCIETEADVDALELPDLKNAGYMTKIFNYYEYMRAHLDDNIPMTLGSANSPFTIAALIRGTSEFIGDLVLNPEFAQKLLRKITDLVLIYLKEQRRISRPDEFTRILLFDDLSGFVNIGLFRKYVVPMYEEIYGAFPDCQRWYHNDSDTTPVLEAIAEAGIQMFHYGYQVDANYIKETIGDRVCLMGNVAPLEILRNGTSQEVDSAFRETIRKSGYYGGLVVAAGGYIDEGTPLANIEAMIEACTKYGKEEQIRALQALEYAPEERKDVSVPRAASEDEDDPRLAQFPNLKRLKKSIIDGTLGDIASLVEVSVADGLAAQDILDIAIIPGMDEVGRLFSRGDIFIPEMMMAAKCTKVGMDILNPILAGGDERAKVKGKIAIGTVHGDLHDIGKDIVISMMQGAGLEVIDLGVDCPPEKYCEAVEQGADLIGLSAILTTVIPNMKKAIAMLEEKGLRDRCKVLIGGAAVTPHAVIEVGADAYCEDAGEGVRIAKEFIGTA
ncbi:MAG: dihydropteroate synthase [Desulfobacterales bacterium]|nr:dihydropteroate synthase [Desulfobacterales bacterium]